MMENDAPNRPLIFISNDDSIHAPGLHRLVEVAVEYGDVMVVAPDDGRSGQSSAFTVTSPLFITPHDDYMGAKMFSVNGTPVDCVKLGMHVLGGRKPDLMLSGINHGSNAGNSVVYSGTMGAAFEAAMLGIPAVGFSLLHHSIKADFTRCMPYIRRITEMLIERGSQLLPAGVCLNVNFPAKVEIEGLKVCRSAHSRWTDEYKDYVDPFGRPFFMLTGRQVNDEPDATDTDLYWLDRNYATAVPVAADRSYCEAIADLSKAF